jgi:hypothetical protein
LIFPFTIYDTTILQAFESIAALVLQSDALSAGTHVLLRTGSEASERLLGHFPSVRLVIYVYPGSHEKERLNRKIQSKISAYAPGWLQAGVIVGLS